MSLFSYVTAPSIFSLKKVLKREQIERMKGESEWEGGERSRVRVVNKSKMKQRDTEVKKQREMWSEKVETECETNEEKELMEKWKGKIE